MATFAKPNRNREEDSTRKAAKERTQTEKEAEEAKSLASSLSILLDPSDWSRIMEKKNKNKVLENLKAERQRKKNKAAKKKLQISDVYSDDGDGMSRS
ncbi:unnamed protein product [Clavelina lepadiformis]|uniref:Uncharacterized protein n=1 Tax=Clavelina lepadiformis TaxID=159417 RepID=A0ABP0GJY8_CLALP